jgi:predicted Zn-dependent peptidase
MIYGPEHPYAVKGDFTQESVGRMGRDVAMGWKKHYSAKNATLIVVGDFEAERMKGLIAENFGSWGGGMVDPPVPPAHRARTGPEYLGVIDPKPVAHMTVSIAYPAPAGIDGQQAARQVLVAMLNMRLAAIRTELGSTYGTYAFRDTRVGPTAYVMGGEVDSARAGESLKAMRDKIDSLRRGEDFDRDFAVARRTVLKRLLAEGGNTQDLSGRLAQIAAYNLAPDFYDQQVRFVAAVSPAQVKALIEAELKPEAEIIALLHSRETLQKAFDEAGLGDKPIRYFEPK